MVALELSCSVTPISLSWWWCIINRWRRAARKRSKNGEAWNSESCYFRRNKQRGGWTCSVFHSLNDILVRQSFLARPVHTFLSSEIEFRWLLFRTTLMHPLHVFLMGEIELYIWPIFNPPLYAPLQGFSEVQALHKEPKWPSLTKFRETRQSAFRSFTFSGCAKSLCFLDKEDMFICNIWGSIATTEHNMTEELPPYIILILMIMSPPSL